LSECSPSESPPASLPPSVHAMACAHRTHTPYTCVHSHGSLPTASRAQTHTRSAHAHATWPRVRVRSVAAHRIRCSEGRSRQDAPSESWSACCSRALMKDSASSRGPASLLVCMFAAGCRSQRLPLKDAINSKLVVLWCKLCLFVTAQYVLPKRDPFPS
jgi:hypothetical protein